MNQFDLSSWSDLVRNIQKPLQDIHELNMRMVKEMKFLQISDLTKSNSPVELMEKQVSYSIENLHKALDYSKQVNEIFRQSMRPLSQSMRETTKTTLHKATSLLEPSMLHKTATAWEALNPIKTKNQPKRKIKAAARPSSSRIAKSKSTKKPTVAKQSLTKKNEKTARPSSKITKPSLKVTKPNVKTAKPSVKMAKPNTKMAKKINMGNMAKNIIKTNIKTAKKRGSSGIKAGKTPNSLHLASRNPSSSTSLKRTKVASKLGKKL